MKKLLLINPNFPRKIMGQTPLNLAYLAAACEPYVQVKIIDLNVQSLEVLHNALREWQPTHVGMSRYTPNNISSIKLLGEIHDKYPYIITIVGGPHEIFRGHITRERHPWINHIVVDRKGENSLVKILTGVEHKIDWKNLFPAYHLLDMSERTYKFDPHLFDGKSMIQYMSSRGCDMGCSFCSSDSYASLDSDIVINHLHRIKEMGYTALFFNDVNFISSVPRVTDLMNKIIKSCLNIEWGCQTAFADIVTPRLFQLMSDAGCSYIAFSVENVSPLALRKLGKRIEPEAVLQKAQYAKSLGIRLGAYVMFGVHEEEADDFFWAEKTLDRIEEISPDYVSYSILANYPPALLPSGQEYETAEYGIEEVWDFFDEGRAYHPYCSLAHAENLRQMIVKRHESWKHIRTF